MPVVFLVAALGFLAYVATRRGAGAGATGSDAPVAPAIAIDVNPTTGGTATGTGAPKTAADIVTEVQTDSSTGQQRAIGIVSTGASIGTAIAPGLGTAAGAFVGSLVVGVVELFFDPTKTALDKDYSKFGMPFCDRATENGKDTVKIYVPGTDGMPISITLQKSYLLQRIASGDSTCLQSMISGRMFAWRPTESTPVNDLIYEACPWLRTWKLAGPWEVDFLDNSIDLGGLFGSPKKSDIQKLLANLRTVFATRHCFYNPREWIFAPYDKNPTLFSAGPEMRGALGPLKLYAYAGVPKSDLTWLTKTAKPERFYQAALQADTATISRAVTTLGMSVPVQVATNASNKSDLEYAAQYYGKAPAFSGALQMRGASFRGAWQWLSADTFRVWHTARKVAGDLRTKVQIETKASLADFDDIFGGIAATKAALQAGKIAPGSPLQDGRAAARWIEILDRGTSMTMKQAVANVGALTGSTLSSAPVVSATKLISSTTLIRR